MDSHVYNERRGLDWSRLKAESVCEGGVCGCVRVGCVRVCVCRVQNLPVNWCPSDGRFCTTQGSVIVNVTWPEVAEDTNVIPTYHSYVMLALSNYWPTSWTVVIPPWRQLSEVIVVSEHALLSAQK